jgi:hypothetical protein
MQRVRIGLTGLSCVFLLVLLAAAFLGFADRQAGSESVSMATAAVSNEAVAADEAPKDPLAELGVAPGNPQEEPAGNVSDAGPAR